MTMKHLTFYFDFVSPYAYLAFHQLPHAVAGHSVCVSYRPIVLGALFKHWGHVAPADVPAKRAWVYRQCLWLAQQAGLPMQMPAQHPFYPLTLLRLALACGTDGTVNRWVAETVMAHVWAAGADPNDPARLADLQARLQPARAPSDPAVQAQLRANTDAAVAAGVFGVPTVVVDDRTYWGLDALPMVSAHLAGQTMPDADWDAVNAVPRDARLTHPRPA